ncbi:helix-turn-helix transcriptional regulator [Burkholderia sp. MSMB1589WGS]|uniref:helix-turn-helix domain-containing protein n=2 Tax=Burkholderia TaxID=32008 RepID=UPI001E59E90E|nr:helix-turn-helix transcriptional regulator [Burkholderia sp. MSMB1589WGS]
MSTGPMSEKRNTQHERLREERERLGLSQAKFAAACGIGKTAQYTYEAGERTPDAAYLEAAGRLGVDVWYVVLGERTTSDMIATMALRTVLNHITERLGLDHQQVELAVKTAEEHERNETGWQRSESDPVATYELVSRIVSDALAKRDELSQTTLQAVLEGVENTLRESGQDISSAKKAAAIALLYRSFVATGKIDTKAISDALTLAAG